MHEATLCKAAQTVFNGLLQQVGKTVAGPATAGNTTFDWDGVRLKLLPITRQNSGSAVLFVFTLTGFRIAEAATLAQLLHYNRSLLMDCELPACFCVDESGHHVEFQQRMLLNEMPLWTLQRYIEDTVERLRDLFVVLV